MSPGEAEAAQLLFFVLCLGLGIAGLIELARRGIARLIRRDLRYRVILDDRRLHGGA